MGDRVKVGLAKFIHDGNFARAEFDAGPDIMENNGLYDLLDEMGVEVTETRTARLTEEDEREYGTIYRLGLASSHMSEIVSSQIRRGEFSLALISNCIGLMGVLCGVQRSGGGQPLRVGLIYFDAHADINTPETTRSGLMGGMPVASSIGLCFHRLRRQAGLEVPLPTRYVTYVGVREVDPLSTRYWTAAMSSTSPSMMSRPCPARSGSRWIGCHGSLTSSTSISILMC